MKDYERLRKPIRTLFDAFIKKILTLVSVGQIDWSRTAKHLLKVFTLTGLRIEELFVSTAHFGLFAIIAHVISGTIAIVRHEI